MSVKIQYCSDLHLEMELNRKWIKKNSLEIKGEILVLGGDIIPFVELELHNYFLDYVSAHYKAVYWVPGNHEYYHSSINERSGTIYEVIRDNVFLVNNTTVAIGDTDLICSTLWSQISPANEWEINRGMNDFKLIKCGGNRLSEYAYNQLHLQARQYVVKAIEDSTARNKVVLTHHVPTFMNYPPKYKGDALNEAFATKMHDYIATTGVASWIYGHTHYNTTDFMIGNTRMLTNQLGYVRYGEHSTFDNARIIVIE